MSRPKLEDRPCKLCGAPIAFIESGKSKFDRLDDPDRRKRFHVVDAQPLSVVARAGHVSNGYTLHKLTCSALKSKRVESLTTESS